MENNRRKFLLTGGLVAGAAALGGLRVMAAGREPASAHQYVSSIISSYGRTLEASGEGEHPTEFRVKVRSIEHFTRAFNPQGGPPFARIHAAGNTLKFTHGGVDFTIVNVA